MCPVVFCYHWARLLFLALLWRSGWLTWLTRLTILLSFPRTLSSALYFQRWHLDARTFPKLVACRTRFNHFAFSGHPYFRLHSEPPVVCLKITQRKTQSLKSPNLYRLVGRLYHQVHHCPNRSLDRLLGQCLLRHSKRRHCFSH